MGMASLIVILLLLTLFLACTYFLAVPSRLLYCYSSPPGPVESRILTREEILPALQKELSQCVAADGLGLQAEVKDHCLLLLKYPKGTNSTWFNRQFKVYEPLDYLFDVCDTLLLWEQYRNVTTILTREYLDARPNGWLEYAPTRISQLCDNRSLCEDELQLVLPANPPFKPRQFATCAVVGNSGDLLLTNFGSEIDAHDAVFRDNEAPVNEAAHPEKCPSRGIPPIYITDVSGLWRASIFITTLKTYAKHVGRKRTFRLIAEGVARNLQEVVKGYAEEVLIIKSKIHRDFNAMIKEIPNPVYLFQGVEFRRGAKGTGVKSIELAVSMCDEVDIYGFTVDPGYADCIRAEGRNPVICWVSSSRSESSKVESPLWTKIGTRYFSEPRRGHNPLQGRAYYQLLECLGVIKIHSPMREKRKQDWSAVPSRQLLLEARAAAFKLKSHPLKVGLDPYAACGLWTSSTTTAGPLSGALDMSSIRRASNYSRWEQLNVTNLRSEAQDHQARVGGVTFYKIDGNKLDSLLCVEPP